MRRILFSLFRLLTPLFASYHAERILRQLYKALVSAIDTTHPQRHLIPRVLRDLTVLEDRPQYLTGLAYEWCSVVCENYQSFGDWESLLLISLEIGFRRLDTPDWRLETTLNHTEHHRGLADVVFKSKDGEAIADLLCAWTALAPEPAHTLLGIYTEHLTELQDLMPFSSRLRRLVIRSIELIGYKGLKEVGMEKFIELLNHLHVGVNDVDRGFEWIALLLDAIQSPGGVECLFNRSWELLAELVIPRQELVMDVTHSPQVIASLLEAREWDKLEPWLGVVWMLWPPETDEAAEDLERAMMLLFRRRPAAAQKLTKWMEQRSNQGAFEVFQRTCKRAYEAIQQDTP